MGIIKILPQKGIRATGPIFGGSTGPLSKGGHTIPFPPVFSGVIVPVPTQIMGLMPMYPCGYADCRDEQQWECYHTPAFGVLGLKTASYENDVYTFGQDITSGPATTIQWQIKKMQNPYWSKGLPYQWNTVATITNNNYGTYIPLGSLVDHPTYTIFQANWGLIVKAFGPGIYKIVMNECITDRASGTGGAQASVADVLLAPYYLASISGGSKYESDAVQVALTLTLGTSIYKLNFTLGKGLTQAQQLAAISSQINANSNSIIFPFTATVVGNGVTISGMNYASQNGTLVDCFYTWVRDNFDSELKGQLSGGVNNSGGGTTTTCACAAESLTILARQWDCKLANHTVKFECWNTGWIGSERDDGYGFDLCNLNYYDSLRIYGFFGEKTFEYNELLIEYGIDNSHLLGQIDRVRDLAIRGWKLSTEPLPQWVHDRLGTYMMMADEVLASDYNLNNADYFLKQRRIIKKGAWKPEYLDGEVWDAKDRVYGRTASVDVDFVAGIQSLMKSTCCQTLGVMSPGTLGSPAVGPGAI